MSGIHDFLDLRAPGYQVNWLAHTHKDRSHSDSARNRAQVFLSHVGGIEAGANHDIRPREGSDKEPKLLRPLPPRPL